MNDNKRRFTKGLLQKAGWDIYSAEQVTPEEVFHSRRKVIKALGIGALGASLPINAQAGLLDFFGKPQDKVQFETSPLTFMEDHKYDIPDPQTPYEKITTTNNFYEFGVNKQDPSENAQGFKVNPWQLSLSGEVDKPITLDYNALTTMFPLEERIYRMRCVEAWSMVVPWVGFPLGELLKKAGVTSKGHYVAFETLYDPKQMPGQRNEFTGGGIKYPYVEGLTMAEAMNDLTMLTVGLYGKTLPPQDGAPIRLIVPWKYGFKSIKSIVKITVVEKQPPTSWNQLAPDEYGFYANVNPAVDHPRWSQATERRIGGGGVFSTERINTLPFNGYGEYVADLYKGMDLKRYF